MDTPETRTGISNAASAPGFITTPWEKFLELVQNAGELDEIIIKTSRLFDQNDRHDRCWNLISIVRSGGGVSVIANAGRGQPDKSFRIDFEVDLLPAVRQLLDQKCRLAIAASALPAALPLSIAARTKRTDELSGELETAYDIVLKAARARIDALRDRMALAIKPGPLPQYPEIVLAEAPPYGSHPLKHEIALSSVMTEESLRLALEWHDGEKFYLPKVAARIAETAVMEWLRNAGHAVQDLSIQQIESPAGGDWKSADIRLADGTLVDVKNTTRSLGRMQHRIKQFKVRAGVSVRYVGTVFTANFGPGDKAKFYDELHSKGSPAPLAHAREVIQRRLAGSRIRLLGATTREEIVALEAFAKARTANVIFEISGNASATPPFVWNPWDRLEGADFLEKLRTRDAAIDTALGYPDAGELQDPMIFLARNLPAPRAWPWERRAIHEDLRKILNGAAPSLGRLYLSVLQHFLNCCRAEHDGTTFLPRHYDEYFAQCELSDPGRCFERLLSAIRALVPRAAEPRCFPALNQITVTDAGTVIAISGHNGTPNKTLLAHCVECGASLVFGADRTCDEERLICEECGACSCGARPLKSESCKYSSP